MKIDTSVFLWVKSIDTRRGVLGWLMHLAKWSHRQLCRHHKPCLLWRELHISCGPLQSERHRDTTGTALLESLLAQIEVVAISELMKSQARILLVVKLPLRLSAFQSITCLISRK